MRGRDNKHMHRRNPSRLRAHVAMSTSVFTPCILNDLPLSKSQTVDCTSEVNQQVRWASRALINNSPRTGRMRCKRRAPTHFHLFRNRSGDDAPVAELEHAPHTREHLVELGDEAARFALDAVSLRNPVSPNREVDFGRTGKARRSQPV